MSHLTSSGDLFFLRAKTHDVGRVGTSGAAGHRSSRLTSNCFPQPALSPRHLYAWDNPLPVPMKLIASITLLFAASCASIVNGSTSDVQITSAEPGLEFRTDTGLHGVTPQLVSLPNGRTVNFTWEANGNAGNTVSKPHLNGWIAGNILFGGVLGIIIDVVNPQARVHKGNLFIGPITPAMAEEQRLKALQAASDNDDNF